MIISALQISQKHLNFTHYDLHVENILIRQCEPEAIFVYNINDNLSPMKNKHMNNNEQPLYKNFIRNIHLLDILQNTKIHFSSFKNKYMNLQIFFIEIMYHVTLKKKNH
jgi:hypothetical protein